MWSHLRIFFLSLTLILECLSVYVFTFRKLNCSINFLNFCSSFLRFGKIYIIVCFFFLGTLVPFFTLLVYLIYSCFHLKLNWIYFVENCIAFFIFPKISSLFFHFGPLLNIYLKFSLFLPFSD